MPDANKYLQIIKAQKKSFLADDLIYKQVKPALYADLCIAALLSALLVFFTILLFVKQNTHFITLGILVSIVLAVVFLALSLSRRLITTSLHVHYINKKLLEANQQLERLNHNLHHEISERQRVEQSLEALATYDVLTGLPNRNLFHARLSHAANRALRLGKLMALLFFDLDHFKKVNDTLGHEIGDQLLIQVSGRLKRVLRKVDTVARIGGDEFTIILEELNNPEEAAKIAITLCRIIATPFIMNGHEITVTTSIGISLYPTDSEDLQILIKEADIAMYRAKKKAVIIMNFTPLKWEKIFSLDNIWK